MINQEAWQQIRSELDARGATLVAVSKTKPVADIEALYALGQRDFGENYVQELVAKQGQLPADVRWHFIGHLQSNKVKYIAPYVSLIHGIDSFKLLQEVSRQGARCGRVLDVLLQLHIAEEETKYGLSEKELIELLQYYEAQQQDLGHVRICGLMGMATFTEDESRVRAEFDRLYAVFRNLQQSDFLGKAWFNTCSMGMSADYRIALDAGSNMVRKGSLLFGSRN